MEENGIIETLKHLASLNSTPFLVQERSQFIQDLLVSHHLSYELNGNYILVKLNSKSNKPKLLFVSHLDHPGIILKNNHEGIILGSVLNNLQSRLNSLKGVELDVYTKENKKLGEIRVLESTKYSIKFNAAFEIPRNAYTKLKINDFNATGDFIEAYALDNDAPTAVLLGLLKNSDNILSENFEVHILFTFFEEVHQFSSYEFAKENLLGLNESDFVINLECKEVLDDNKTLNNESLVIHSGESFCEYGYLFDTPNLALEIAQKACEDSYIPVQIGITKGSTDARSFSNFRITPNIITISIPNFYKHNIDPNGTVVAEKIYKNHLFDLYNLVSSIIKSEYPRFQNSKKIETKIYDVDEMRHKMIVNERISIAYKPWVLYKKVYPENFVELFSFFSFKVLSYVRYYYLKLMKVL